VSEPEGGDEDDDRPPRRVEPASRFRMGPLSVSDFHEWSRAQWVAYCRTALVTLVVGLVLFGAVLGGLGAFLVVLSRLYPDGVPWQITVAAIGAAGGTSGVALIRDVLRERGGQHRPAAGSPDPVHQRPQRPPQELPAADGKSQDEDDGQAV
jgi:hypothetical protein